MRYQNRQIQTESTIKVTSQDGGVGRNTLLPRTTKKRTTNLKMKNNQNCQKIELYGSLTTKELKKKHSSRLVGGVETGSQGGEDMRQGSGWRTHICVPINWDETTTDPDRLHNPGFQDGKRKPPNLWL